MTTTPRTDPIARLVTNAALILTVIFVLAGLWPPPMAPGPVQIIATPPLGVVSVPTAAPVVTTIVLIATPTPAPIEAVPMAAEVAPDPPVAEAPAVVEAAPTPVLAPTAIIGQHGSRPSNRPGPTGGATYQTNAL